jgi:uncharacterized membrane protein YphA (DoxX/SURF4 family)
MNSENMKKILTNGWLSLITRFALAGIFLYAAWDKFLYPGDFAINVMAYKILPSSLVNLTAVALPSLEIVLGIVLLVGLFPRGASLMAGVLMLIFMSAFALAMIKGVNLADCGCFSTTHPIEDSAKGSSYTSMLILRDIGYLLLAIQVFFGKHKYSLQNVFAKK